jgi:hypothetical protein
LPSWAQTLFDPVPALLLCRIHGEQEKKMASTLEIRKTSSVHLFGLPLYDIAIGGAHPQRARGIVAIGQVATGVIAIGPVACGFVAIGAVSLGVFAVGAVTLGALAAGAVALGGDVAGAVAIGYHAVGAVLL